VCMCVCLCVCLCVYMCVYVYIYVFVFFLFRYPSFVCGADGIGREMLLCWIHKTPTTQHYTREIKRCVLCPVTDISPLLCVLYPQKDLICIITPFPPYKNSCQHVSYSSFKVGVFMYVCVSVFTSILLLYRLFKMSLNEH